MADKNEKDLDFDELHKAVNALMDQTQKGRSRVEKQQTVRAEEPVPTQPKQVEPIPDTEDDGKIQVNVKRPTAAVAKHRGSHGRAMDVVGPIRREAPAPPSNRPKREAAAIQPTQQVKPEPVAPVVTEPVATPDTSQDLNDALATLDKQESKPAAAEMSAMTHHKNDWPDPLDVLADDDEKHHDQPESSEPAPTVEVKEDQPAQDDSLESESPFVTTKVEKRPLGAYSDSTPAVEDEQPAAAKDAPIHTPPQSQPEEFNPAVVAVESAESNPRSEDQEDDKPDLRAMAIPQQYADSDKQDNDSSRPVFDTKEYHPAITAHSGSSSHNPIGAWIMAIVLIGLLVGVLIGAYYLITGGLDFSALI